MYDASSGVMRAILSQILPYLIIKKEQAKIALEFLQYVKTNSIKGRRIVPLQYYDGLDALFMAMKKLNQKEGQVLCNNYGLFDRKLNYSETLGAKKYHSFAPWSFNFMVNLIGFFVLNSSSTVSVTPPRARRIPET